MTLYYANGQSIEPISYTGSHKGERIISWFNRMNDIKDNILSSSNSIPLTLVSSNNVITQYLTVGNLGIDTDDSPDFGGITITPENYGFSLTLDQLGSNVIFSDCLINGKSYDTISDIPLYHSNSIKFDTNIFTHEAHYMDNAFSFSSNGISYTLGSLGVGISDPQYEVDVLGDSSFLGIYEKNNRIFSPSNQPTATDVGLENTLNVDHVANSGGVFTGGVDFSAILDLENIGFGGGYSITHTENDTFRTADEDTAMFGLAFSDDGLKMFTCGITNDSIYQYVLVWPFNVLTATYDGISFSVATQDSSPYDLAFNNDGTKMYILGRGNDSIYQYTLSTGWNLSTASYDSVSFSISGQSTSPQGLEFNNTGTKMYMMGSDIIHQYSLSTSWNLSTASYDSVSFNPTGQHSNPEDFTFNSDGSKLYVGASTAPAVLLEYDLSTSFDLSTASYNSVSFSYYTDASGVRNIATNDDDSRIYVSYFGSVIQQIDLSTSGDVSSGILGTYTVPISEDSVVYNIAFDSNSTKMYILGDNNDTVYQYSLSMARDLSTASYDSVSFSVAAQETMVRGLEFNNTGTKMYVSGYNTSSIYQYSLSTAWDLSTASYDFVSFSTSGENDSPIALRFNNDGSKMYVLGLELVDTIYQYSLSTPFDISTTSYDGVTFTPSGQVDAPRGFDFNNNGTKLFISDTGTDSVHQYSLSTAFDLLTATDDNVSFLLHKAGSNGFIFNDLGSKMYLISQRGSSPDTIFEFSIPLYLQYK